MASPEAALVAALNADAGVTAYASGRVNIWGGKEVTVYPYVTIQRISTVGAAHLNGPTDLEWPRMQIDVWTPVALDALNTAEAIRLAIDNITQTAAGLTFTAIFQNQSGPAPDPETRNFRTSQDYLVFYSR